jgi:hypothetical protein
MTHAPSCRDMRCSDDDLTVDKNPVVARCRTSGNVQPINGWRSKLNLISDQSWATFFRSTRDDETGF